VVGLVGIAMILKVSRRDPTVGVAVVYQVPFGKYECRGDESSKPFLSLYPCVLFLQISRAVGREGRESFSFEAWHHIFETAISAHLL